MPPDCSPLPDFLDLPRRQGKPRSTGLTHVLDKCLSELALRSVLDASGPYIDIVKLGWGTAYVSRAVSAKVAMCHSAGVHVSPGGTLLEIAVSQGKLNEFAAWAADQGFDTVEVSDGTIDLGRRRRISIISSLARNFRVVSEVGCKDDAALIDPAHWVSSMLDDLDAGADYVIAEGRESGTVGLYDKAGRVRAELVETLLSAVPASKIIFEAPAKAHQAWFVERVGPEVNLGNVAPDDVIGVETLRRGLRADTVSLSIACSSTALVAQALFERTG